MLKKRAATRRNCFVWNWHKKSREQMDADGKCIYFILFAMSMSVFVTSLATRLNFNWTQMFSSLLDLHKHVSESKSAEMRCLYAWCMPTLNCNDNDYMTTSHGMICIGTCLHMPAPPAHIQVRNTSLQTQSGSAAAGRRERKRTWRFHLHLATRSAWYGTRGLGL